MPHCTLDGWTRPTGQANSVHLTHEVHGRVGATVPYRTTEGHCVSLHRKDTQLDYIKLTDQIGQMPTIGASL